jgi:hypothetical protein
MPHPLPNARTALRQHEVPSRTASGQHAGNEYALKSTEASTPDEDSSPAPNPLWAINAGLGAFLAIVALIIMFT